MYLMLWCDGVWGHLMADIVIVVVVGVKPHDAAMMCVCGPCGPVLVGGNVRDLWVELRGCMSECIDW